MCGPIEDRPIDTTAGRQREARPGELALGTAVRVTGDSIAAAHGITGETGEIVRYTGPDYRRRALVATDPTQREWGSVVLAGARWVGPGDLEALDTFAPGDVVDDTRDAYFSPEWQAVTVVERNGKPNGEHTLWDVRRDDGTLGTISERHLRRHVEGGLVVTDDGSILNWRGVNYVRQEEPAKPAGGTRGSVLIGDTRVVHGVIDDDGDFAYVDLNDGLAELEYAYSDSDAFKTFAPEAD